MAYPQQNQDHEMLKLLDYELEEALQRTDPQLELSVRLSPAPTALRIRGSGTDVTERLSLTSSQAFSMLERLVEDEYIRGSTERTSGYMGKAVLYSLTDKGLTLIGRKADPNKELIEVLDAIAAAIEELQCAKPERKTLPRKALGELKHFARGLPPEAAAELAKALPNLLGNG